MKIVITSSGYLLGWGGTQRFAQVLSSELSKKHEVVVITKALSSKITNQFDCEVTNNIPKDIDLLIVDSAEFLTIPAKKKYFIIHGIITKPCHGADKYFAISEELQEKFIEYNPRVLRNPVYSEFFKMKSTRMKVPRIGIYSKPGEKIEGYDFIWADYDLAEQLSSYDLIITKGRGAIEAMSLGIPVISYGWRDYESEPMGAGYITPDNFKQARATNFTGRGFDKIDLNDEIAKYNSLDGEILRKLVVDHDIKKVAKNL